MEGSENRLQIEIQTPAITAMGFSDYERDCDHVLDLNAWLVHQLE